MQSIDDYGMGGGKRQKCIDNGNIVNLICRRHAYTKTINEDIQQWEHFKCIANALLEDCMKDKVRDLVGSIETICVEVEDDTNQLLQSFSVL